MNPLSTDPEAGLRGTWNRFAVLLTGLISHDLLALVARLSIATIFLQSGRTKVDGVLHVTDSAVFLFSEEYKLPLLSPDAAAHMAVYAEHFFPLLLILGLFTRLSALALFGMTLVIQVFVYPDAWATHLGWAGLLLYLVGRGAGLISVDRLLHLK